MNTSSRRSFVRQVAGSIGITSLPSLLAAQHADPIKTFKIVCVGGHPDDPESGCGGTLAKFTASGHAVTIIYLTRGEAGIPGKSHSEAAAIRSAEAMKSCALLKAKPLFAGQIDGDTVINKEWINKMQAMIEGEKPDIVFAHWPLDFHVDHQNAGTLAIQTWMRAKNKFDLYFFEVCTGEQTMGFKPTDYVNITDTQELKRKAVYCHVSQDPPGIYECGHKAMESFRGRENGTPAAEAYIRMTGMGEGNEFKF